MKNHKLFETIADIAYLAGQKGYYSGDSRADISEFIYWACQFEKAHSKTDWGNTDYILEIENFASDKIASHKN